MSETSRWLTTTEAGRMLGVSGTTAYRLAMAGKLDARRTSPAGHWRIREESVKQYQESMIENSYFERTE